MPDSRCDDVKQHLCRRAVGDASSALAEGAEGAESAESLARHARGCAECRRFADDLAGVARWLERRSPSGRPAAAAHASLDDPLIRRACAALERELGARLARDLLELGQGRPDREPDQRRLDLVRLAALGGLRALRRPPWRGAVRLLSARRGCVDRRRALRLALQLDPVGLDVALAYLSQLERDGQSAHADAEADRLLGLLA